MKKIFLLVMMVVFISSSTCFAESNDEIRPLGQYSTTHTSTKQYDNIGNAFKITSKGTVGVNYGYVSTSFEVTNYGGGVASSINGVRETCYVDSTVYFVNGTTPNYTTLDGSSSVTGLSSGSCAKSYSQFTADVSILNCVHTFTTSSGISYSFTTTTTK